MPSFKRAVPAPPPAPAPDPFAQAVSKLAAPPNPSAAQGLPSAVSRPPGGTARPQFKARKSVRWRPDEELVKARTIEWRGDPLDERGERTQFAQDEGGEEDMDEGSDDSDDMDQDSVKGMMEEQEGATLAAHFGAEDVEEEIEWYEPRRELFYRCLAESDVG